MSRPGRLQNPTPNQPKSIQKSGRRSRAAHASLSCLYYQQCQRTRSKLDRRVKRRLRITTQFCIPDRSLKNVFEADRQPLGRTVWLAGGAVAVDDRLIGPPRFPSQRLFSRKTHWAENRRKMPKTRPFRRVATSPACHGTRIGGLLRPVRFVGGQIFWRPDPVF